MSGEILIELLDRLEKVEQKLRQVELRLRQINELITYGKKLS